MENMNNSSLIKSSAGESTTKKVGADKTAGLTSGWRFTRRSAICLLTNANHNTTKCSVRPKATPRRSGHFLLCAVCAAALLHSPWSAAQTDSNSDPMREDTLPEAPPYRGEIRRAPTGELIVIPAEATPATNLATTGRKAGRTITVGHGKAIRSIAQAAALARDGDTIEIAVGDYPHDVAVWTQNNLTIRALNNAKADPEAAPDSGRVRLIANGASAEQKAIWVVRGGKVSIENIDFFGAHVKDKNGAGIRFEAGDLTISHCRFLDNENGILTAADPNATLTIENSEFAHNGAGDGYSHNLYVGAIKKLSVTGSYFHHANVGHLLKSRARENHILYNRLTDETGGRASYELEFPNGGTAYVIGNIIEQSATTENPTLISFGAEGYKTPKNALYLINNTLVDHRPGNGMFLAVKPGASGITAYNNLLLGKRLLNTGLDGLFVNNPNVDATSFVLSDRHDYRIARGSGLERTYVAPPSIKETGGPTLAPQQEYVHSAATRRLTGTPTLPGARQTMAPDLPSTR